MSDSDAAAGAAVLTISVLASDDFVHAIAQKTSTRASNDASIFFILDSFPTDTVKSLSELFLLIIPYHQQNGCTFTGKLQDNIFLPRSKLVIR